MSLNNPSSVQTSEEYKRQKSKKFLSFKYFSLFLVFFLFIFSLIFLRCTKLFRHKPLYSKRNLSSYSSSNSNANEEDEEKRSFFPVVVLIFYITFLLMSIYTVIIMRIISEKTEELRLEVYKFMYMANNGYLFISAIDGMISGSGLVFTCLFISGGILITGTIIYIVKFIKVIINGFFDVYLSFDILCLWYSLPFKYVWPFLGLTDPCCYKSTYTVTIYSDGTVTDDRCYVMLTNRIIYLIKRGAMLISTILYYLFLIMITLIWLLIKLIIIAVEKIKKSCKKTEIQNQNENPADVQINGNMNNNIVNNNALNLNMRRNKTHIQKKANNNIIDNNNIDSNNGQVITLKPKRKGKLKKRKTAVIKTNININTIGQGETENEENNMNQIKGKNEDIKTNNYKNDINNNNNNKNIEINYNKPISEENNNIYITSEDGLNERPAPLKV